MREASYYQATKNLINCKLCPRDCLISEGFRGYCNTRLNQGGKLYSLVYGNPTGFQVDPIEKKPLYHFYPDSRVLSFGTQGCNFKCKYCCNHFFSQAKPSINDERVSPIGLVDAALKNHCQGIAYTYNEPSIFYEYAFDVMKLAHAKGLFNVFVTNGCISKEPVLDLDPYLDAVVIDFKGFNEEFYREYVDAELDWVKQGVEYYSKIRAHKEVTNLVVPGLNDDPEELRSLCEFIKKSLGPETPFHLLKFFPLFEMRDVPETPISLLKNCYAIAKRTGLRNVYLGNVSELTSTYCAFCGELIIKRSPFKSFLTDGKCPKCGNQTSIKSSVPNSNPLFG